MIAKAFGSFIPLPVEPSLYPSTLVISIGYGLLTALAFSLWPLGRAHDISVSMLFRDQIAAERRWRLSSPMTTASQRCSLLPPQPSSSLCDLSLRW